MMREKPSVRIRQLMSERGLRQIDIVEMSKPYQEKYGINMTRSHVSQYVNDKSNPDQDKYFLLSRTLGVTEPWLMGYDVPKYPRDSEQDIVVIYNQLTDENQGKVYDFADGLLNKQMTVKVYGQSAAGQALTYGDDMVEEEAVSYVPKGADRALYIKGDSMEPVIKDSSIVFYKEQPQVENGEIAIVEIHNEAVTCKKVKFDFENEKIVLQSLNEKYKDLEFDNSEIRILGKVVQ